MARTPVTSSTKEDADVIGRSASADAIREEIDYASRCDAKLLITGESGVGKEVVARLVHARSKRKHSPMVTVNCAALTETLLETELFGHVRGSFTGAMRDRSGVLEQANRGTAFMDEIGETTPRMQGLLLRFLETGEIQRVGSDRPNGRVDVRIIAATNRDLLASVREKTFREDLYYRLNVIHIQIPPLRERLEDVPPLLEHFIEHFAREHGRPAPRLSPDTVSILSNCRWPGNVRELKNFVERLVVRGHTSVIEPHHLPTEMLRGEPDEIPAGDIESAQPAAAVRSRADELFERMIVRRESFWTAVYPLFMARDMTRDDVRALVRKGLERTTGSYRVLVDLFNMPPDDYRRFLNFLRKHQCQEPFQPFRVAGAPSPVGADGQPTRGPEIENT
jgi:transcriptional regulator with PAS, ATPase and Fis domain